MFYRRKDEVSIEAESKTRYRKWLKRQKKNKLSEELVKQRGR